MNPLELLDQFRRWLGWVALGRQLWERNPEKVAPDRSPVLLRHLTQP